MKIWNGRAGRWRAYVKACALSLLALAGTGTSNSAWAEDGGSALDLSDVNYRLGDGLHIPGLGLTLGGYVTGSYDKLTGVSQRLALNDVSLSAWWESGRWKVFTEFDEENTLSSRSAETEDEDRYLALERFYIDYSYGELTTIRVGKFLTPIGRWNLIHATPLVWTTSRPLVTTVAFPTNVTGLMVTGSFNAWGQAVEYSVYGSNGNEIRPNPALDTFHEAEGLRVVLPVSSGMQLGYSYVSFEQEQPLVEHRQLYGLDFFWKFGRCELWAEGVHRVLHDPGNRNEGGGFVQFVAPITDKLYGVMRYESYRETQQTAATGLHVLGFSYRLTPAIVLKAEFVDARHNDIGAQQGFLSSVSVLF